MLDANARARPEPRTPSRPAHAPADHPALPPERVGVLLANLGTPDGYDYWSMRRYLSEFLSDRRVIDYPRWKWQPLLQTVILGQAALHLGRQLPLDLERGAEREPARHHHPGADRRHRRGDARAPRRRGAWSTTACATATPRPASRVDGDGRGGLPPHPLLPALPAIRGGHHGHRERPVLPRADGPRWQPAVRDGAALFRRPRLHRRAGAVGRAGLGRGRGGARASSSARTTACPSAT